MQKIKEQSVIKLQEENKKLEKLKEEEAKRLEKEKIIVTIVGRGTFITENLDAIKPNYELIDTLLEELVREAKICGITKEELIKKIDEVFMEK